MNKIRPYHNDSLNTLYNLLFCDDIDLYKTQRKGMSGYPWDTLCASGADKNALWEIINDPGAETRIKLLAYHRLHTAGFPVNQRVLLGVILEVGLDQGPDTLAAYQDGTVRYINQAEKMIVWEAPTAESNAIVRQLLEAGDKVVQQTGPWNKERLPAPANGDIRLNFLVSNGLYFGQGPFTALQSDAMGGPVIDAGLKLLQFLTAH